MNGADLLIDGRIVLDGMVMLNGDAQFWEDGFSSRMVREALVAHGPGPVTIHLNSYGGHASEGEAIRAVLVDHPEQITVRVTGMAYSAASLLAMGADRLEMTEGSLLMIHDPSGMAWGTEADMRKQAEALAKTADVYAAVYANRAGIEKEEAREIMRAETWYSPEEAIAAGFADAIATGGKDPEPAEMAGAIEAARAVMSERRQAFASLAAGVHQIRETSAARPALTETAMSGNPAPAATTKEVSMSDITQTPAQVGDAAGKEKPVDAAAVRMAALEEEKQRRGEIRAMAQPFVARGQIPQAKLDAMVDDPAVTVEMARGQILDTLAEDQGQDTGRPGAKAQVLHDVVDRTSEGMERALLARARMDGGERNEFSAMTLREMARESLRARNVAPQGDVLQMIGQAFVPVMAGGGHTTSDFGNVLANIAGKAMLMGWDEAVETFEMFTRVGSLTDFKPTKRVGLDAFPSLTKVEEGGEYQYGTMGDHGETAVLATYGKRLNISRQAIVNDDLSAFTLIPQRMGRAARRTVGDMVYAILTGNPLMSDGVALFAAGHNNLAASGAGPSEATINAAVTAMAQQKDRSGNATALNIPPAYIIAGHKWRSAVLQSLNSEYSPDDTAKAGSAKQPQAYNTVRGIAQPIFDARLTGDEWFVVTDPARFDTIEVSYLGGNAAPVLEQQDGWAVDGTEFKVRLDAAATALAYEGMYKNPGS